MTTHRAANLAFQLGGDAGLLKDLAKDADVLELVECRDRNNRAVRVGRILGRDFKTFQSVTSGDRAGSVIAVRRSSGLKWRRSRLRRISPAGRNVQARYLRTLELRDADGWFTVGAAHPPLVSTGLQELAIGNLATWWARTPGRKALFGDGNRTHSYIKARLKSHRSAGADVMFGTWSSEWDTVTVQTSKMAGTDHAVIRFRTSGARKP